MLEAVLDELRLRDARQQEVTVQSSRNEDVDETI